MTVDGAAAPRGIVFDLDGTLIDSRQDIATAVNRMRAERGLPPLSVEAVGGMVGEGARVLVRRALVAGEAAGDLDMDKTQVRSALDSYLSHYADVCLETTRAYRGVVALLATLGPSYALAVLTNKGEDLSRRILTGLGLDRHFREVVGGDTLPTRKPNPGGLFLLADRLSIAAGELLLVGDSEIDAETARAAGSPFALALWGGATAAADSGVAPAAESEDSEDSPPAWRLYRPRDLAASLGLTLDLED